MLVKFYESKFGARCTPGLVLLLLTAWYSFTWKILISSAKRNFVIVTDLASFDCLIQVKILWSIYFVNHSNFFWLPTVLSTIYIFDYWGWAVGDDGAVLCGVELELIQLELVTPRHHYFFWSPVEQSLIFAHERSALQAVTFLQCLYSFSLIEYRKGVAPNKYY